MNRCVSTSQMKTIRRKRQDKTLADNWQADKLSLVLPINSPCGGWFAASLAMFNKNSVKLVQLEGCLKENQWAMLMKMPQKYKDLKSNKECDREQICAIWAYLTRKKSPSKNDAVSE